MDGVGLDTGRHAACGTLNIALKNIPNRISTDHGNMLVFTRLHHLNEFHQCVCELSFRPLRALNLQ